MGKSDKKVRAESINKLRKQYDAFLEEDRKRKERNDNILTKLDKMCNTVTHHKGNACVDPRAPLTSFGDISTNLIKQVPMQIDIRNKYADEAYLLSQITKKYILIPKLRPMIDNDCSPTEIKRDNNNDSDWKSKYSILEKLKQKEKEEADNALIVNDQNEKFHDSPRELWELKCRKDDDDSDKTVKLNTIEDMKNEQASKFILMPRNLQDLQDKENTTKQNLQDVEWPTNAINAKQTIEYELNVPSKPNEEFNVRNYTDDRNDVHTHQQKQLNSDSTKISSLVNNGPASEVYEQIKPGLYEKIADHQTSDKNDSKHETESTEKAAHQEPDISHVEVIQTAQLPQEKCGSDENKDGSEGTNYPIDIINVQDFTPHNNVTLVDGVNINPEGHDAAAAYYTQNYQSSPDTTAFVEQDKNQTPEHQETVNVTGDVKPGLVTGEVYTDPTQQYINLEDQVADEAYNESSQQYETTTTDFENMENVLGIQAFEAEQNEMFYSEQPAQNYEQYNQEGDAYNAGYTEPMEGYDPTTYYESTQQEAFPVEINEHEETSQRYDPVYEQQYGITGAEGAQYAEQAQYEEQVQNEQDELVPTNLEYDQSQYNAEQLSISEQVEQQLDYEAGYTQNPLDDSNEGVEESVPYQQIPDQTQVQKEANVVVSQK